MGLKSPDQTLFSELDEQDPRIARNIRLLERAFIPNTPELNNLDEEEIAQFFLSRGESRNEGKGVMMYAINIKYNTRTGEITKPVDGLLTRDGDLSILRTFLITDGEKVDRDAEHNRWVSIPGIYKILLAYPKDWLTPHAIDTAVDQQYGAGIGIDPLKDEGQWILPERVIVERVKQYGWSIMGHPESWGTSQFVEKPEDVVLFRSIELFNKKHGPSLTEQFFRGTDVHK